MMSDREQQITTIAGSFAGVLREWLTPAEFAEMKALNETPEFSDGCCASHNYCDANMAMDAAFQKAFGRGPIMGEDENPAGAEADCAIWNEAWDLARKLYLGSMKATEVGGYA